MFGVKSNNQSVSRFPHFPSSDGSSNNRNLFTADQRNNRQTDSLSSSSTHSNDSSSGVHNNCGRRIAKFVRFVNKTLPRDNSGSRSRNTRTNVVCPGEQPPNPVRPHQDQGTNEASQQPSTSNDPPYPEPARHLITNGSSTTRTNNELSTNNTSHVVEEGNYDDDDDDDEYVDVGDLSSSEDDDDVPFESMYNRRIPIPSTLFANTRRVSSSRPGVRHNTRRHSLRRQSRYITPDQFNWESPMSHSTLRRNKPSSTTYSSAYANILPLSLSHSRSLSLPSNDSRSIHSRKHSQTSTKSNADGHVNDDDQVEDCLVCLEPLELRGGRMILNPGCGHLMHMKCYMEYINNCKDSCAICAKKFPVWDH